MMVLSIKEQDDTCVRYKCLSRISDPATVLSMFHRTLIQQFLFLVPAMSTLTTGDLGILIFFGIRRRIVTPVVIDPGNSYG